MKTTNYTFGHTMLAAERLGRIAEFFNPLSSRFVKSNVKRKIQTAVDLGCGPGFTTYMLAGASEARNVIGLDISEKFINIASDAYPNYMFLKHDITQMNSLLCTDLFYCRFILSHLINIKEVVSNWMEHLIPGGYLIIDELEDIETNVSVFKKYLHISDELVRSQGAELFVGKILDDQLPDFKIIKNESEIIPVPDATAASWFLPNALGVWSESEVVANLITEDERNTIAIGLDKIAGSGSKDSHITWKMKRIVLTTK